MMVCRRINCCMWEALRRVRYSFRFMSSQNNIMLVVRQRDKVVFEGEVKAFSSINERGNFDILYSHANFISIIKKNYAIHNIDGTKSEIEIDEGIVRAYGNKVTVYLGILG